MIVDTQLCAICRTPYTPQKRGQRWSETCGSTRCRNVLARRRQDGRAAAESYRATMLEKRTARIAALTASRFGALSAREEAIFEFGRREGYQQGQNAARRGLARQERHSA